MTEQINQSPTGQVPSAASRGEAAGDRTAAPTQPERPQSILIYQATLKTRRKMEATIPRERWGWWIDVCPGQKLTLRDATAADLARCSLREGETRGPADFFCELPSDGALVSHEAVDRYYTVAVPIATDRRPSQPQGHGAPTGQSRTSRGEPVGDRAAAPTQPEGLLKRSDYDKGCGVAPDGAYICNCGSCE